MWRIGGVSAARSSRVCFLAFFLSWLSIPALAQDISAGGVTLARAKGISPEATKVLPQQKDLEGRLMPVHAASVMEWACTDSGVLSAIGTSKSGCYQALRPGLAECEAELQSALPATSDGQAVATQRAPSQFRLQLRQCVQQVYVNSRLAAQQAVVPLPITNLDPQGAPGLAP
jgi:hypothetical protein